jgi:SAM-dependent methyltransferase
MALRFGCFCAGRATGSARGIGHACSGTLLHQPVNRLQDLSFPGGTDIICDIYRDGERYDRLFPSLSQDLPFWIATAREYGGPVLELGSGTGRVAIPLAQEGFGVTGIDTSEGMLQEARRKSFAAKVEVEWVIADMRAFDLDNAYSLIILPNNTLCHLLHRSDLEACLASVRKHLTPTGKFVIDVFVPKMELLIDQPEARFPFSEYDDPDNEGRVVVTESYIYETDTQIKRVTTWHAIPGMDEEVAEALDLRMYFPQELDALLEYNGFAIDGKFGDYEQTVFGAQSEKQIIVCSVARQGVPLF